LSRALESGPQGEQRYFAELLFGRAEEARGRHASAREHYQNAAALYPRAQSPRLALSQLSRQSGDRQAALQMLQTVTTLPVAAPGRTDPWWTYNDVHVGDADTLLTALYDAIRKDGAR
jgi:hypothetical protein